MEAFLEFAKVLILGILEGITEWLPISSTGHLLLFDEYLHLNESDGFKEVFFVVIQLGAILAVFFHFGKKMIPFTRTEKKLRLSPNTTALWIKVVLACIPGAVFTLLLDDVLESFLNHTQIKGHLPLMPAVIALALILYGIVFVLTERKSKAPRITQTKDIRFSDAFVIGLFQTLSIVPGTSRSGSTIIGAMCLGISRPVATEFSFFLAVPVMLGYSLLKLLRFGLAFSPYQLRLLLAGSLAAFLTSLVVIRSLTSYVKKHSFTAFGVYRILLGFLILLRYLA